mmetsp:Transcript_13712/g.28892  ORF Transcript_13712/g.28892 Transcript_13712/m.28892 type:complete len:207 (+) Transcript_13712:672-1292(+)
MQQQQPLGTVKFLVFDMFVLSIENCVRGGVLLQSSNRQVIDAPHRIVDVLRPVPPRRLLLEHRVEPLDDLGRVAFGEGTKVFDYGLLDQYLGLVGGQPPDRRFRVGNEGGTPLLSEEELLNDRWQDGIEVDVQARFIEDATGTAGQESGERVGRRRCLQRLVLVFGQGDASPRIPVDVQQFDVLVIAAHQDVSQVVEIKGTDAHQR